MSKKEELQQLQSILSEVKAKVKEYNALAKKLDFEQRIGYVYGEGEDCECSISSPGAEGWFPSSIC